MAAGMSMLPASALRPGVYLSPPTAAALMPLPRNWIQAATYSGTHFSAAAELMTKAEVSRWMAAAMSMWQVGAMRPGVHPSAPIPAATTPLPRNWIQAALHSGTHFSAAAAMTLAMVSRWMAAGMSRWQAKA